MDSRVRLSDIVSKILHPLLSLPIVVGLIAYNINLEYLSSFIIVLTACIPAFLSSYLYSIAKVQVMALLMHDKQNRVHSQSQSALRENPNDLTIVSLIFGCSSISALYVFDAPIEIMVIMIGVSLSMLVTAQVNRIFRSSMHMAFFTSTMVALSILADVWWLYLAPFVVLLGLSRFQLHKHTAIQLFLGLIIGIAATLPVINAFNLY